MSLEGKIALITGSSRGIGAATAIKFAENGANIVINYNSNYKKAEELAEKIKRFERKVICIKANVANLSEVDNLIKKTLAEFNKIDILVNNAGITSDKLLLRMSEDNWDKVMSTNLKGTFNCTKSVIRHMLKKRSGKIINVSSVVGIMGNMGQSNYAASKAGIIGFTKSIAKEVGSRGINVNAIAPGYIETEMTKNLSEDIRNEMLKSIPLSKFGNVEDVANLITFLASDAANYIHGQLINVDGGMLM